MFRWFWKLWPHSHTMENEIYIGQAIYGYWTPSAGELVGQRLTIGGYEVECKKCGAHYVVPVG